MKIRVVKLVWLFRGEDCCSWLLFLFEAKHHKQLLDRFAGSAAEHSWVVLDALCLVHREHIGYWPHQVVDQLTDRLVVVETPSLARLTNEVQRYVVTAFQSPSRMVFRVLICFQIYKMLQLRRANGRTDLEVLVCEFYVGLVVLVLDQMQLAKLSAAKFGGKLLGIQLSMVHYFFKLDHIILWSC